MILTTLVALTLTAHARMPVSGAVLETADGHLCYVPASKRPQIVPSLFEPVPARDVPPELPACADDALDDLARRFDPKSASLEFKVLAAPLCMYASVLGAIDEFVNSERLTRTRVSAGAIFGAGAGVAGSLDGSAWTRTRVIAGNALVGGACWALGEGVIKTIYYLTDTE